MAELIRKNTIIANTASAWEVIRNAPKINETVVKENNTSKTLNIVWYGTAAEYQALPLKHPDTFYIVTDSLLPSEVENYNLYTNKPKVNGVELDGNASLADLDLYNREEFEAMLRQIGRILVVAPETWEQIEADPTLGLANTIYYVEKETEGAYDTYMMDANFAITYLGSNDAFFTEYQKCHPTTKVKGAVKDSIKIGDGTVVGALDTFGDNKTLSTATKDSAVKALNEVNIQKLGQEHISHHLTNFGVWQSGAKNRNYKLATITFNSPYEYFTATFKFLSNYKNFMLSGSEINFNLRAGAKSLDALQLYELSSYDVPDNMPQGKAYIYIYYNKPTSWPQEAEIWFLTKGADYQEFTGDWQIKETMPAYPLAKFNLIEKPVDDQNFVHYTGGNFNIDLGKQKNNVLVLEGAMTATVTSATRDSIKTAANGRSGYVESLVQFTAAESPDGKANSVFNVHIMTLNGKTSLFAMNVETQYEYRATHNGSKWGDWDYIFGVDGGIGGLQSITTAPKINVGTFSPGSKNTVQNMKFTYSCIDMGEYYINELRIACEDAGAFFQNELFDSTYRLIDGNFMQFSSIKGKPIIDGGIYASSFILQQFPKLAWRHYYDTGAGSTYIKSNGMIVIGPRGLTNESRTECNYSFPGAFDMRDPRYPFYVEYNFLTRK